LDTYHPDILYLREHGSEVPWIFSKQRGIRDPKVWETMLTL